jgi:2-methylcitrate dehydratase PrpD
MLSCIVHCGPVIIPAALSIAEREGNTGKEFLTAVIAGYEMMTRIGNVVNSGIARMSHHKKGFHATATTGVFGASLTASKLLGLSKEQALNALGIAGSYASGILESMTSPEAETWRTHTGIAAQNGVTAAILSKLGLKGPSTVLEGKNGFFSVFGEKNVNLDKVEEDLGKTFLIMDSAFKLHNCAHVWSIPLDCLTRLIKTHKFRPEDVAEIKVTIPTMYSFVMDESKGNKYPRNYAEAQNNLPYVMAAMMIYGRVFIEQFSDRVLRDPRMKEMAGKVKVVIDSSLDEIFKGTDKSPAEVRVTLNDRKELSETGDYPRGSPQNQATREEIEKKVFDLVKILFKKKKALEFVNLVAQIESFDNLRSLFGHLIV